MAKHQAGANSRRQYERGASQMIAASARLAEFDWTSASQTEKLDGLLAYLGGKGTVCHYLPCAQEAIELILGKDDAEAVASAVVTARMVLRGRAGVPATPRGTSLKLKDPLLVELGDVFAHLRWKFIESRDPLDLLLALYIIVMPRIGLRPVEMSWTEWDGSRLFTYTAKRAGRPKRYIPHEHWPPVFRAALGLFVSLVPRELDDAAFEAWRNVLASRLARASQWTRKKRRLSLYFARHIAIANWKQAGITPELIAELAGHAGLRSQSYYASGRSGYGTRYVFVDSNEAQALLGTVTDANIGQLDVVDQKGEGFSSEHQDMVVSAEGEAEVRHGPELTFDLDDRPTPKLKETENSKKEGARFWAEAVRTQDAELERLGNDIARIRRKRAQALRLRDEGADGPHQLDDTDAADDQRRGVKPR